MRIMLSTFYGKKLLTSTRRCSVLVLRRLCWLAAGLAVTLAMTSPLHAETSDSIDPDLANALRTAIADADSFEDRYDAEVWLLSKSSPLERYLPDHSERMVFLRKVHREATRAGLKPEIVLAVIDVESRFNPYAVSRVGAQGLMQVMPFWKNEIGRPEDNLIDTDTNLRYGCTILKHYLDREKGRLAEALARYNGSYGKYWYSELVFNAWDRRWR